MHVPDDAIAWTERLHAVVDELAAPVAIANASRLRCRAGCSGCCSDGLTVFAIEAAVIAHRHPDVLAEAPHAEGACAFLDATGACRVYDARPYVCRTQGLPLRWLDEDEDGATFEARDICPLNVGSPIEELPAEACWTLGPIEQRLAARQAEIDGGELRRVALRDLFASSPAKRRLDVI
ncbi:MAG TPA: YkgJ family cysteine cluster protein [Labilithrix sp.]|jgi:Fe-S-cluster containining protein